jgi:plastocyanin
MTLTRKAFFSILISLVLLSISCSKAPVAANNTAKASANLQPIDPATTATISGTVTFAGTPPQPEKIDMSADPACKGDNSWRSVVVDNSRLANVLVYVKSGQGEHQFDHPSTKLTVEQKGCTYHPHVAAVMAGQPVEFLDDDMAMHNVHPKTKNNKEWNQAEQANGGSVTRTFQNPELMILVGCNQHPWMKMYLSVMSNPFFAVTGPDGSFTLKGLPPGTYTIGAVQEKLGEKTETITVGPKEDKQGVTFAY